MENAIKHFRKEWKNPDICESEESKANRLFKKTAEGEQIQEQMNPLYQYIGTVEKIYDGDTITDIDIDLGFGIIMTEEKIRLYGIDTFEMRDSINNKRTPEEKEMAIMARDLFRRTTIGKKVLLKTFKTSKVVAKDKRGKYGRWLARVFVNSADLYSEFEGKIEETNKLGAGIHLGHIASVKINGVTFACINDLFLELKWATEEKY